MADVQAATELATGQPVAIKLLRSVEPDHVRRFDRELDALQSLDHRAIVSVLDHGEHEGRPYLVLERCDGGSLADVLADGPLGPEAAARLGADLADGLAHAHARGVVHRDVKPSNVLIGDDGSAKLADFGIARLDDSTSLTGTGFTVGTAAYLAPEQARGDPVGPAADVYSLGLLVLELATGHRAFEGAGLAAAVARLHRAPDIPADVPQALRRTLTAMTAMDPSDRPVASVVADELRHQAAPPDGAAADGTGVLPLFADATSPIPVAMPVAEAVARPASRPRRSRWLPLAACFVAGFLLVTLLGRALLGDDNGGATDVTTTTVLATTTVSTTTTTAAPIEDEDDEDRGNGNGNDNGNGRGRGDDD